MVVGRRPDRFGSGARHVVVVGGGLAGLTAARGILVRRPETSVTILEGSPHIGGKLRLGEVGGRPVDLGAESILNRRPEGVDLARDLGLADVIIHPRTTGAGIWTRGEVRRMPPTLMGVPIGLDALRRSGVVSASGVARAWADRILGPVDVDSDVAIGRLVTRRLGREVTDSLVEPLLGGVYAGWPDQLSLRATVPALAVAIGGRRTLLEAAAAAARPAGPSGRAAGPGTGEAAPVFAGLEGGVARLAHEVFRDVESRGGKVRRGAMVRRLRRTPSGWQVELGPEAVAADAVVMAVPATPAARMLAESVPEAARELAAVEYASVVVVTLALWAVDLPALTGTGFLVPSVEQRSIKAATFSSNKWAWQASGGGEQVVVLRCSVGRLGEEATLQRTDDDLIQAVRTDLEAAVGIRAAPVDALVTRWGGALPQYAVGHLDRVGRIRRAIAAEPGLAICGAVLDGVGIPAVIATAGAAARDVVGYLDDVPLAEHGTMDP